MTATSIGRRRTSPRCAGAVRPGKGGSVHHRPHRQLGAPGAPHRRRGRRPPGGGAHAGGPRVGLAAGAASREGGGVRARWTGARLSARREILAALQAGAWWASSSTRTPACRGCSFPSSGGRRTPPAQPRTSHGASDCRCSSGSFTASRDGGHELRTELVKPAGASATGLTARLTARIEAEIRAHPTDWVWMHERWRQRPGQQDTEITCLPGQPWECNLHTRAPRCWPAAVRAWYSKRSVPRLVRLACCRWLSWSPAGALGGAAPPAPRASEPPAIELERRRVPRQHGQLLRAHGFARRVFYRRDTGEAWASDVRVLVPRPQSRSGTVTLRGPASAGESPRVPPPRAGWRHLREPGRRPWGDRAPELLRRRRAGHGDQSIDPLGAQLHAHREGFRWTAAGDVLDLGPATLVSRSDL